MLAFVPVAGVDRRCRLPSQAAFESHSSILRHASEVTRPVCASFLRRKCGNHYRAWFGLADERFARHEQFPESVRQFNVVPRVLSGPAPLRLPMTWLGDDDILSRAEATARGAWRALLAAAAEDERAILAGETLACKRSCTRPRGRRCSCATASSAGRSQRHNRSALSRTKAQQIERAPFSLTKPRQVLSQRKNCK